MVTNVETVKAAYAAAENPLDVAQFVSLFATDGYLHDVSSAKTYRGRDVGSLVEEFHKAFPDMHREILNLYALDDVVVAELSLNGTHEGPLATPEGTIAATGKRVSVPCCDVWVVKNGKISSFHCYTAATILAAQLR